MALLTYPMLFMNIPRLFAPTKMMHVLNWVASSANFYFMFSLVTHCVHIDKNACTVINIGVECLKRRTDGSTKAPIKLLKH